MTNPGGLRTDLLVDDVFGGEEPGEVTVGELNAVLPFANDHGVVMLTGADVIQLHRGAVAAGRGRRARSSTWASPTSSTSSTTPTRSAASTSCPSSSTVRRSTPNAEYRVATLSFLASGGDNFSAFANGEFQQSGITDFEVWENYFETRDVVEGDPQERQAEFDLDVINTEDLTASFAYSGGEEIEVEQGGDVGLTFMTEAARDIDGPFDLALELPEGFSADLAGVEDAFTGRERHGCGVRVLEEDRRGHDGERAHRRCRRRRGGRRTHGHRDADRGSGARVVGRQPAARQPFARPHRHRHRCPAG